MKKWLIASMLGVSSALLSTVTFAGNSFFCPNTMQYVQVGSNQVTVLTACGEPYAKEELEEANKVTEPAEIWFYQVGGVATPIHLTFTLIKGRVTEIEIGNKKVESTSLCQIGDEYNTVKIGDTSDMVLIACTNPNLVNTTTITEKLGTNKVVVWFYDFGNFQPKAKFKFVNGTLTEIEPVGER